MAKIKGVKALYALVAQIDALYPTVDKPAKQADLLLEKANVLRDIAKMEQAADADAAAAQAQKISILTEQIAVLTEQVTELERDNARLQTTAVLARIASPVVATQSPAAKITDDARFTQVSREQPLPLPAPKHREFDASVDLAWRHVYTKPEPVTPPKPAPQLYIPDLRDAETKIAEAKASVRRAW
jgi:hypothetical protein